MIFNPLFIDSDNGQLNLPTMKKNSGSHLFQDIIKLEDKMLGTREFNSSSILPGLLSEVKKMKTVGEYNTKFSTTNLLNSNQKLASQYNSFAKFNEEDIHNLLQKVFSDIKVEGKQSSVVSEDILANLNTDDLINKIEQKLTDQGDVKCLISNVDDNTNLLLTIQKADSNDVQNSVDGKILTQTDEGDGTVENYVVKVLELGKDEDSYPNNMINSGLVDTSAIMQLMNQQVSPHKVNSTIWDSNVFDINALDHPDVLNGKEAGSTQASSPANQNPAQINNFQTELSNTDSSVIKANSVKVDNVLPTSVVTEGGEILTQYPESKNTVGQKLQDAKSPLKFIPTGTSSGDVTTSSSQPEIIETNNNSDVDFLVKVSSKDMPKVSDKDLLSNMNYKIGMNNSSAENSLSAESKGSVSDIPGKTDVAKADMMKIIVEEGSKDAASSDSMLKHFPDTKGNDGKNINLNNAGNENNQVRESSSSSSSNGSFAQNDSGQGKNSSSESNSTTQESKSPSVFKIEEHGNNIMQTSGQTQEASGRVVKLDSQSISNPQLANEVSDEISEMVISKGRDKATIVLEPKELGKIKIALEVKDNHVHAKVEVENNTVKEMLQTNSDTLKQTLNNSGLQLGSLNISLQQNTEKGSSQSSSKQAKRSEKVEKVDESNSNISETAGENKAMGYNTYEYII